ncbi:MAG: efflux RND transporter periplasmic adaptor subunit [Pseudanabaenaceae cyanobacterium SKYGB_i_bin29]|nr:efflux RND transporter periplasmic adaptor subunit [Pseudanabaenaceae cyanobacterium SKYG29]MDW8420459.1 efflux RND transporter periplasmic adaptor subunit [Pseudanabaenaceae cyanobacterium SKYGB_i_bin29]
MAVTISKGRTPYWLWWLGGSVVCLGAIALLSLRPNREPAVSLAKTAVVERITLPVTLGASGKVVPSQTVNLSPKVGGKLVELLVDQGDRVVEGQIVARMDSSSIEPQLQQAAALVASAQANLARLRNGARPEEINAAKAQVAAAQARAELAQKRLDRFVALAKEGVIPTDRMDEIIAEANSAQANLRDRQKQLERLLNGARPEEIAQAEAQLQEAQARLAAVKVQLEDTIIRAPFAGIITQKYANVGAFVTPTTTATLTSSATSTSIVALARGLEILAEIPEVDISQVQVGQAVEIIADAYPDRVYQGKVRLIAPEAVVQQNVTSFQVRIDLLTGQDQLRSGMNVELKLKGREIPQAIVVPTVAIVTEGGQTGVYVDQGGKPEFRPVTIGSTFNQQTQILSGLTGGERIYLELPRR